MFESRPIWPWNTVKANIHLHPQTEAAVADPTARWAEGTETLSLLSFSQTVNSSAVNELKHENTVTSHVNVSF